MYANCENGDFGQQRETRKKAARWALKSRKFTKYFLRNVTIFQSLMSGDAKWHGFLHIGAHLVAKGVPHGSDPPHFHMHTGKIGQFFFEVWGFPAVNVEFGVDGPHNTTGDLQTIPGTPTIHFPLGAAGSQSAL